MAKKKNWWSKVIVTQIAWWKNFVIGVTLYQTELEVTVDELAVVTDDSAMFVYVFAQEQEELLYHEKLITYRRTLIDGTPESLIGLPPEMVVLTPPTEVAGGMMNRTFSFVKAIRERAGFTPIIEVALKVVGADIPAFNPTTFIAKGKGKTTYDGNLIGFTKGPFLEGVGIWMQRGSDPLFYFLKDITRGEFLDSQLNLAAGPETRQYFVRGFINNIYVGSPCAPFSLTWTSAPPTVMAAAPTGVGMPAPATDAAKVADTETPPATV